MNKKIRTIILAVVFAGSLLFPVIGQADEGLGVNFSAVVPENQVEATTYFDLLVKPDSQQTLTMQVANLGDTEKHLKISGTTAYTNENGLIDYNKVKVAKDSSAKTTFSDMISTPQTITLKAKEIKNVTFQLKVPKAAFSGTVLGGFYLESLDKSNQTTSNSGIQIDNRYAMIIGAKLRENLTEKIKPNLKLNAVKPGLVHDYTALLVNIQNTAPAMFGEATLKAEVTKKGESQPIRTASAEGIEMAPNSNFDYAIDWNKEAIEPGDYHLKVEITSTKEKENHWILEKDFTIKKQQAKQTNDQAIVTAKDNTWLYITIGVVLLIIIAILSFILGKKRGNKGDN